MTSCFHMGQTGDLRKDMMGSIIPASFESLNVIIISAISLRDVIRIVLFVSCLICRKSPVLETST